jgi:hypothetical protein
VKEDEVDTKPSVVDTKQALATQEGVTRASHASRISATYSLRWGFSCGLLFFGDKLTIRGIESIRL